MMSLPSIRRSTEVAGVPSWRNETPHHETIASPATTSARTSPCDPASLSAAAARFVHASGPGAACAPNSPAMRVRSTTPASVKLPPPKSGARRDVHPRPAPSRQYLGSNPSVSTRSWRSTATGALSARNLSVVCLKNSCSSVGSTIMHSTRFGSSRIRAEFGLNDKCPRPPRALSGHSCAFLVR
jgi:hypothetical protein